MKSIKRDTLLVVIAVLTLTLVCIRTSYAAFVSIQTQSELQSIKSGVLDVTIDNLSTAMSNSNLFPTPNNELPTASNSTVPNTHSYSRLILNNDGDLDADYSVTISYDSLPVGKTADDLVGFNYLRIGIFDVDNNEWINFSQSGSVYNTIIANLTPTEPNVYPILRDVIDATDTREFRVYVWLDEDIPDTEIGKIVYLKLNVKSTTINGHVED